MADPAAPFAGHLIDGKRAPAADGARRAVINPATGQVIAQVAEAGPRDVDAAVAAARRSFDEGGWRKAGPGRASPRDARAGRADPSGRRVR